MFWDLDGTLVDSEKLWDVSLAELARRLGGELSTGARAAMVGSHLYRTLELMFADLGRAPEPGESDEAGEWLLQRTGELFAAGTPWRPGAREALTAVRDAGLPTALVTSTYRALTTIVVDAIGPRFFDAVVCGDEVAEPKPAPGPYLRAAELLGVDPRRCVAVEDSPTGTSSAVAAGCTVLVVPCEVPVSPGERRILRESLVGVDAAFFADLVDDRAA